MYIALLFIKYEADALIVDHALAINRSKTKTGAKKEFNKDDRLISAVNDITTTKQHGKLETDFYIALNNRVSLT